MCKKSISVILSVLVTMVLALFAACSGGGDSNSSSAPATNPVTLDKTAITLSIDGEDTLQVLGGEEGQTVVWEAKNPKVATVANGKVTGVSLGTTVVTATVGEKTLECSVTVVIFYENVVEIELENEVQDNTSFRLLTGDTYTFKPALIDGTKVENVTFTLTSNNAAITVSGMTITAVEAVEEAEVKIACTYNGQAYSLTVYVSVDQEV